MNRLDSTNQKALHQLATESLRQGGVCILPTETVHGIMALASSFEARQRIYTMKQRDVSKQLQILLPNVDCLSWLNIAITPDLEKLATFWPGGLTLVVDGPDGNSYGVRIPDHPWLQNVLLEVGEPVVATSANASGHDPADSLAAGFLDLAESPDLIITAELRDGEPSTVVRLENGDLTCLREGVIPYARLTACLDGGND